MPQGFVSVRDHRELRAVVLAFKALPQAIRKDLNKAVRDALNPIWRDELNATAHTTMDTRIILAGARVKAGNPPVVLAAQSTRAIGGRLRPADWWFAWEFGANRNKVTSYERVSRNGGTHPVRRHVSRGLPDRRRGGRVAFPAFAATAPRMLSRWVQGVVRIIHDAAEGQG